MNYDRQPSRPKKQRRPLKDWWTCLATMWQNFFIALLIVVVLSICYVAYIFLGDVVPYTGMALGALLFMWLMVALVRDF